MYWDMNELTERLLAQGYTPDNHPDYVRWYQNANEFEYTLKFLSSSTWEAPCGVMRKGKFTNGYGWINGVCWRVENNNYNFHCPYRKQECEFFHPLLKCVGYAGKCSWHMTDKQYDYDNSVEKIAVERQELTMKNLEKRFGYPGMIHCNCCHINEETCEPYLKFDVEQCLRFTANGCDNQTCYCTGKERNIKKANIYYDVKVTTERQIGFIVEPIIKAFKGKRLFDSPKRITDLETYLKLYPDAPIKKEMGSREYQKNMHFITYHDEYRKYEMEISNIRIEAKESKDLMQDLLDAREGIEVIHQSDQIKQAKASKSERRATAKEKKLVRLENNIIKTGYEAMEPMEKCRAEKLLSRERIKELDNLRKQRIKADKEKPVQMSLFD